MPLKIYRDLTIKYDRLDELYNIGVWCQWSPIDKDHWSASDDIVRAPVHSCTEAKEQPIGGERNFGDIRQQKDREREREREREKDMMG